MEAPFLTLFVPNRLFLLRFHGVFATEGSGLRGCGRNDWPVLLEHVDDRRTLGAADEEDKWRAALGRTGLEIRRSRTTRLCVLDIHQRGELAFFELGKERIRYAASQSLLLGSLRPYVIPAWLECRGALCLHGNTLIAPNHAHEVTILAEQGTGKSTLSMALVHRGWRLKSDDLTAFRETAEQKWESSTGDRGIALRDDSWHVFNRHTTAYTRARHRLDKRVMAVPTHEVAGARRHFVVLERVPADRGSLKPRPQWTPLSPLQGFQALLDHTYFGAGVALLAPLAERATRLASLARSARFARLSMPSDFKLLDDTCGVLEAATADLQDPPWPPRAAGGCPSAREAIRA